MLTDLGWLKRVKLLNASDAVINPATNEKLDELKTLLTAISGYVDELEIKAENINLNTDTLEAKIQSVRDQLDVLLSTRASEATSQSLLNAIGTGSGTNLLSEIQAILGKLNTDLDTRASEATLVQVRDYLDTVETKLQTIIDTLDVNLSTRASEATLEEVRDTIGQESGATVLSKLQDIWDKLSSLFSDGLAKFKIWDGTYNVTVSPENELRVKPPSQILLEEHFNDASLDEYKWSDSLSGSGSISLSSSFANLSVTTASGDSAEIYSVQSFVHIFSQTYSFRSGIILDEYSLNNNTRIWGMRNQTTNDGWYFRLQNGVLQACTEFNSTVTATSIDSYKPTDGNVHRYDAIYRNYRVLFYIDETLVHTATATATPLYDNEELTAYFRNYNTGITTASVSLKVEGLALFDDTSSLKKVAGIDENGLIRTLALTPVGRLKISQEPPDAPVESTPVIETEYSGVATTHDNVYIIPSGETLIIQRFSAGAEVDSTAGNVVELWYDPLGTGVGMTIIDAIFCSGDGDQHDLREEYLGDGTKAIRMRRKRFSGGSKEIFGRWEGYY